jgi:hypothetical protein
VRGEDGFRRDGEYEIDLLDWSAVIGNGPHATLQAGERPEVVQVADQVLGMHRNHIKQVPLALICIYDRRTNTWAVGVLVPARCCQPKWSYEKNRSI